MKFEPDFFRETLLNFEQSDDIWEVSTMAYGGNPEEKKRHYHILLATDEGLLAPVSKDCYRLTSEGHKFLDATRDKSTWERTKKKVAETGGSATIEIFRAVAWGLLKKTVKKKQGLKSRLRNRFSSFI